MSDSLDPRDDLTERLAALGRQPVAPSVQSEHLTAMSSVASARSFRASLVGRLKVGAGVFAGFLIGASGLASVGGLGPLQPIVAERAAEVADVHLPQGPKDKAAKAAKAKKDVDGKGSIGTPRDWTNGEGPDCVPADGGKFAGNRGQYLKQERAAGPEALAAAKASTCGLPLGAEKDADDSDTNAKEPKVKEPKVEDDDDEDAGKSDEEHGKKDAAPGQEDKGEPGDNAEGPKEGQGTENKPETPAGPPDEAGKSGVTPPIADPPAEPTPEPPARTAEAAPELGEV